MAVTLKRVTAPAKFDFLESRAPLMPVGSLSVRSPPVEPVDRPESARWGCEDSDDGTEINGLSVRRAHGDASVTPMVRVCMRVLNTQKIRTGHSSSVRLVLPLTLFLCCFG